MHGRRSMTIALDSCVTAKSGPFAILRWCSHYVPAPEISDSHQFFFQCCTVGTHRCGHRYPDCCHCTVHRTQYASCLLLYATHVRNLQVTYALRNGNFNPAIVFSSVQFLGVSSVHDIPGNVIFRAGYRHIICFRAPAVTLYKRHYTIEL